MGIFDLFRKKEQKNIKDIYNDILTDGDYIKINIFNEEKVIEVISTGKNMFNEDGNSKKPHFQLSNEEVEYLKWFVENIDISNYKKEIVKYCNEQYSTYSETEITEADVENVIDITTIVIRLGVLSQSKDGFLYPEISFLGECNCDEEHGICIGFKNKKFLGVDSQDWTL